MFPVKSYYYSPWNILLSHMSLHSLCAYNVFTVRPLALSALLRSRSPFSKCSPCIHLALTVLSAFTYHSVRIYYIEADNNTIHRWWHFKKCQLFTHNFEQISIENIWMGFTSFFSLRNRIYCLFFIYWIANNSKFLMSKHETLVMLYVNCWHLKVQRRACCVHRIISIST